MFLKISNENRILLATERKVSCLSLQDKSIHPLAFFGLLFKIYFFTINCLRHYIRLIRPSATF
ncbi:MAG: hypothetical protein B6D35_02055 [Candidatus Brocadia sp. UTAMX2]|nr:MAG: hypothetical protein B6D35_02055 [Candidatus Brocadia sp. UTAMX2]